MWQEGSFAHGKLHTFLWRWIYREQTLTELTRPALWVTLGVVVVGLLVAVPRDIARARDRRLGRRLKGPQLVTVAQFNRRLHADGMGFVQQPSAFRGTTVVRIPRALESSHVLIMGDSGTGKSALIRQLLQQLERRGETAIVYDPALEYTAQFYTADRGDLILNPLDARSPYWTPSDEWRHEAETLTLATSLFPDRPHENTFFTEAPRRIFAHLLTLKPTPGAARLLALSRRRDRSAPRGHGLRHDDRPAGPGAEKRGPRLPQHGGGHAQAAAVGTGDDRSLECRDVGAPVAPWVAVSHEHA